MSIHTAQAFLGRMRDELRNPKNHAYQEGYAFYLEGYHCASCYNARYLANAALGLSSMAANRSKTYVMRIIKRDGNVIDYGRPWARDWWMDHIPTSGPFQLGADVEWVGLSIAPAH